MMDGKWWKAAFCALAWCLSDMPLHARADMVKGAAPDGNPGEWVTSDDYPPVALHLGIAGAVGFRLSVTKEGTVEHCRVTASSGFDILDEAACNLLKNRAHFVPATDKRGRAIEGSFSSRFVWRLPEGQEALEPLEEHLLKWRLGISNMGAITACLAMDVRDQPIHGAENDLCDAAGEGAPAGMFLDMRGYGSDKVVMVELEDYFVLDRAKHEELFSERPGYETRALIIWRLSIGTEGNVTDCEIIGQRGSAMLLDAYGGYCRNMASIRFDRGGGSGIAPLPMTVWRVFRTGPIKARITDRGMTQEQGTVN